MIRHLLAVLLISVPTPLLAWDPDAVVRLKETRECAACDLSGADLRWAAVYAAELGGAANLVDAVLDGADLSNANLYGANLEGTNLRGANLAGADLSWSSMISADLTDADLTDAKLAGVIFCNTIMPDGTENDANC